MAEDVLEFIAGQSGPYRAKLALAWLVAAEYHGAAAADEAARGWMRAARGELPANIPEVALGRGELDAAGAIPADRLVVRLGMAESLTQARNLIKQGAVSIYRCAV